MARMIDADALKEFIEDCGICAICPQRAPRCSYDCDFPDCVTEKWNVAIDAQPTVDAVSVVRCGECKHSETSEDNSLYCKHWDDHFGFFWDEVKSDDYCSCGERKDHERLDRER